MRQLHLLRERRFGPLFWTQFLGALNDNLFKTAFVFLVTFGALSSSRDAAVWTPLLNGLLILPFFLFSAMAGQLADKYEKSQLIRLVKLWEVAVMALAALGFLTANAWLLAGTVFLMGTQSAFVGPIKYAILPQALGEDTLLPGNALVGTATFLAILVGTMGGGLLMDAGDWAPIATAVLVLMLAGAGVLASRGIPEAPASDPGLRLDWNPLRQAIRVCRYAAEDKTVFRTVLGSSWFWFFGASLLTLLPAYGRDTLEVNERVVTFFLMLFCIGIGIGALACAHVARQRIELGLVPLGALGLSVFVMDLFFASLSYQPVSSSGLMGLGGFFASGGSLRIVFDLAGIAVCGGIYVVPLNTLMQKRSPATRRSRILSASGILSALFMVVSAAMVLGFASIGVPTVHVFLALALLNTAVVVYIFRFVPNAPLRVLVWILVRFVYRLRVSGTEHIPEKGPVLLAANHVTYVDALILTAAVARPVRFVMHYSFADLPGIGPLLRRARVIPIAGRREHPDILRRGLDEIAEALRSGDAVCIFPEGTLTRDGELHEFRKGIERIVTRTPVPVVPMGLQGLWGSWFSRARRRLGNLLRPKLWKRIGVVVGRPIAVDEVSAHHVREQVAALRGVIA